VHPSALSSPQPKWQINWFSRFAQVTTESPYTLQWASLSPKIAPYHRGLDPHLTQFLGWPIQAHNPNFAEMTTEWPYTLQWDTPLPRQNYPVPWGIWAPHLVHGSLGPPESSTETAYRSVQPFLQGSLVWQIDRPRYSVNNSVTVGDVYVRSTAMRSE